MTDQAAMLRALVRGESMTQSATGQIVWIVPNEATESPTHLDVALAEALVERGKQVALAGDHPRIVSQAGSPTDLPNHDSQLPTDSPIVPIAGLSIPQSVAEIDRFVARVVDAASSADWVLMTPEATPQLIEQIGPSVDMVLVMHAPCESGMLNSYGLMKQITATNPRTRVGLWEHEASEEPVAPATKKRLISTCERFLNLTLCDLGCISYQSGSEQQLSEPLSMEEKAGATIGSVADRLIEQLQQTTGERHGFASRSRTA